MNSKRIVVGQIHYVAQGKRSANCGPCGLKMIADYYGIRHPRPGHRLSVHSLNRFMGTSTRWGTEPSDLNRMAKRLGLRPKRIDFQQLPHILKQGHPVLSLFMDEGDTGHYALIVGMEKNQIIFHDSYWGQHFKRSFDSFKKMSSPFRHWLYAYLPAP